MSKGKTKTKNHNKKKKKKSNGLDMPMCKYTWVFLSSIYQIAPIFSLFQKENILVGLKRKHLSPTNFFPSPSSNQTPTKKVFLPIFSPKFFIRLFHFQTITPLNYVITTVQRDGSVLESPLLEELFTKPPRITFIYPKKSKEKEIRVDA